MSTVNNGWRLLVSGFPALEVFTMETSCPCLANQVHPEPKFAVAWAEKSSRNLSTEPHFLTIASLTCPSASV